MKATPLRSSTKILNSTAGYLLMEMDKDCGSREVEYMKNSTGGWSIRPKDNLHKLCYFEIVIYACRPE
jgi:hypothetical protein